MKKQPFILTGFLLIVVFAKASGNFVYAPDAPGKWSYTYLNEGKGGYRSDLNYQLSPSELASFKERIKRVLDVLQDNPVTRNPIGFEPTVQAGIYVNAFSIRYDPAKTAGQVPVAEIVIRFCPLYREISSGKVHKGCDEMEHCDVMLNSLGSTTRNFEHYSGISSDAVMNEEIKKNERRLLCPPACSHTCARCSII